MQYLNSAKRYIWFTAIFFQHPEPGAFRESGRITSRLSPSPEAVRRGIYSLEKFYRTSAGQQSKDGAA